MIRVERIVIREFRGIRDLTLDLRNKNFAVCGPNGTGKSGIVDALEFALTGNISRLSGSGTGGLSAKEHGPHVDSRNKPEEASVTLTVSIPSLNKTSTIHRTIKEARNPKITPDEPAIRAALDHVALHPEFTLSRRELIRYVLSEPGKRSKEVQALLRLDELETLRGTLQKIANASEKEIAPLERDKESAANSLARALDIPKLSTAALLTATNERRRLLGLPLLTVLEANTSIKDGLATTSAAGAVVSRVPKAQALADLKGAREHLDLVAADGFKTVCGAVAEAVGELGKDAESLDSVSREKLLRSALELFDDHTCPVCETPWQPEEFRRVISEKLKRFENVAKRRAEIERQATPIADQLTQLASSLTLIANYGPTLTPAIEVNALRDHVVSLTTSATQLKSLLPLAEATKALEDANFSPGTVVSAFDALETAINALPEPSQQDAARDYLTVGQERLETYRQKLLQLKAAKERAEVARTVSDLYGEVTTKALDAIYNKVEQSFSKLYRLINHEDEGDFQAKLTPSMGKLGFNVEFYGRGFFPPGAYHSEGHQDGMGLCLYLALMRHLLGKDFTFAVLDDVLMSVDAGHRREVSKILREQFPDTQFILTTHDEVWLRHMKSAGLIASDGFAHFRTWNVDSGPTEWDDRDVWHELDGYLEKNDVRSAAALLRHYLEHVSQEICQRLRAKVEFRADAQFMLGDLLPNAIGSLRKHLKAGKAAAQSWGQTEKFGALVVSDTAFSSAAAVSNVEQWQVNAAVHYNEWATLQKEDFEPVVTAFKALIKQFTCNSCGGFLYVVPERGVQEALRCGCANVNINLVTKS